MVVVVEEEEEDEEDEEDDEEDDDEEERDMKLGGVLDDGVNFTNSAPPLVKFPKSAHGSSSMLINSPP